VRIVVSSHPRIAIRLTTYRAPYLLVQEVDRRRTAFQYRSVRIEVGLSMESTVALSTCLADLTHSDVDEFG
jgi:hypothetical protein